MRACFYGFLGMNPKVEFTVIFIGATFLIFLAVWKHLLGFNYHLDIPPHPLHVAYPSECPSLSPYVHVNPATAPHFLHASLNSIYGGSPNVGVIPDHLISGFLMPHPIWF